MSKFIFCCVFNIAFSINTIAQTVQRIELHYVNSSITSIIPISCSAFDTIFNNKIVKTNIDNEIKILMINQSLKIIYEKKNNEIDVRGKIYFFANKESEPFMQFCYDKFFTIAHNEKVLSKTSILYLNLKAILQTK